LLSDAAWDASREDTCRALSLPIEADAFIEQLAEDLDDAYRRTREGLTADHAIHALAASGELPVDRLDALPEPKSLTTLRARVDALIPPADLPDVVLEITAKTEFLDAFTNDHEPNAQLHDLDVSLCAVLVAQACNVGYRPLVDDSNPALRESRLRYVAQRYLRADTLAAANARIVDHHAKLTLAERWGGGEVASIDGLRLVVPRRTIHAGFNRRYFDRRRGVTALGTTADHYAGLRTIVIPGTQPDAPYALDALLDPQTSVRPREIMTDTAGYTDIMFALYRLLGYRYSPRLADSGAASLWRLNATDHGPLNPLARHQIDRRLIREHYDDVLRIAGSLLQRHTTSSQLIRALRSQTRHLATLARALQHIGRAPKTIHLLDYCNDEHFRRRVLVQLNRGEGRHGLARDVCHGRRGELRQAYRDGQEEQLNALGLIVNSIVLYNTIYTQRALDHIAVSTGSEPRDEDIERLSPLGSDHITLTGRYRILLPAPLPQRLPRSQHHRRGRHGLTAACAGDQDADGAVAFRAPFRACGDDGRSRHPGPSAIMSCTSACRGWGPNPVSTQVAPASPHGAISSPGSISTTKSNGPWSGERWRATSAASSASASGPGSSIGNSPSHAEARARGRRFGQRDATQMGILGR
jgi:TnpA family transposase